MSMEEYGDQTRKKLEERNGMKKDSLSYSLEIIGKVEDNEWSR